MRLTYDQMMMMMEDSKGDLIKASVVRSLITSLQYHNYNRHKKHSYSASTFTIPEDPHLYTLRNYSCSPLLLKVIKKNHICKFYKDSDEQYHIIYENFINLYKLYTPHGSRLNNEKPEIFSSYVQQFFLDKGLLTDVLFKVVISICKKEPWVDIKLFTECIEAFQINLFEGMYYFFREPSLEIKVNIELQKLLCKY